MIAADMVKMTNEMEDYGIKSQGSNADYGFYSQNRIKIDQNGVRM